MTCEMFGCNNTETVRQRTIAPGTTVNICDECDESPTMPVVGYNFRAVGKIVDLEKEE